MTPTTPLQFPDPFTSAYLIQLFFLSFLLGFDTFGLAFRTVTTFTRVPVTAMLWTARQRLTKFAICFDFLQIDFDFIRLVELLKLLHVVGLILVQFVHLITEPYTWLLRSFLLYFVIKDSFIAKNTHFKSFKRLVNFIQVVHYDGN